MPDDAIARARAQFDAETTEHTMTVLRDEGLYRHLRFQAAGTRIWSWDVVTWPGYLSITGDIGDGYTFTRVPDMLDWFLSDARASHRINPDYWAEKLARAQRESVRVFDPERGWARALAEIDEWGLAPRDQQAARANFEADWASVEVESEEQHQLLVNAWHFVPSITNDRVISGTAMSFTDVWEWETRTFDHHYLLACFAISHAALAWATHVATLSTRPRLVIELDLAIEHEDGEWEHGTRGYDYATARPSSLTLHDVDPELARLMYAEATDGDFTPDGVVKHEALYEALEPLVNILGSTGGSNT